MDTHVNYIRFADPKYWGINGVDGTFNTRATPRANSIGPPVIPDEILTAFPSIGNLISRHVYQGGYWETRVPVPEARWWSSFSGWNEGAQSVFDEIWSNELNTTVDDLILEYGSGWHNSFQVFAEALHPEFTQRIISATEAGRLRLNNMCVGDIAATLDISLTEGPWRKTLQRRSWPFPNPQTCQVCGASHFFDTVRYYHIRRYGRPGVCARCLDQAAFGHELKNKSRSTLKEGLESIHRLYCETGVIPPSNFRETITTVGMSDEKRRMVIAALMCCPTADSLRRANKNSPWISILQRTGIVGDTWRPARGVICLAKDGHPCKSIGERTIDDWLYRHGFEHQVEPKWPLHSIYNPNGRLRADWRVGSLMIEYAGMMTDKEYSAKIAAKRRLAAATNTPLLVLIPENLYHLDTTLGPALRASIATKLYP